MEFVDVDWCNVAKVAQWANIELVLIISYVGDKSLILGVVHVWGVSYDEGWMLFM